MKQRRRRIFSGEVLLQGMNTKRDALIKCSNDMWLRKCLSMCRQYGPKGGAPKNNTPEMQRVHRKQIGAEGEWEEAHLYMRCWWTPITRQLGRDVFDKPKLTPPTMIARDLDLIKEIGESTLYHNMGGHDDKPATADPCILSIPGNIYIMRSWIWYGCSNVDVSSTR